MKARTGQVVLYMVLVLLAVTVLLLLSVNAFLAVRSKNRMMNAVDRAAIAAAQCQGELLNEIGRLNVERLRAAVRGEPLADAVVGDRLAEMRERAFFGPIEGIARANAAARDWGFESGEAPRALDGFRDHVSEIRNNPDLYPPDEYDTWGRYADALSAALGGTPAVLPFYMEMVNPGMSGLFGNWGFYDVIAARSWCWFTVGNNGRYLDMDPGQMPPTEISPVEVPENSEVFSLHVTFKTWMESGWKDEYVSGVGFTDRWTNFVCQVTGLARENFATNSTAADLTQVWAFYDGSWNKWSATFNPDAFPIAGAVRPEYDVAGCVASCMMVGHIQQLRKDDKTESVSDTLVTAEAKPLGTVDDLDGGGPAPVTAYNGFIAASRPGAQIFTRAGLTLVGSVPRSAGVSMEPQWYEHVKHHAPRESAPGCGYCRLWREWMNPAFRASARAWLQQNSESCHPKGGGPGMTGGYEYAH